MRHKFNKPKKHESKLFKQKKRDQKPELVNYSYSATSFIVESKSPTKAGGACLIFLECFLMRDEMGFFFIFFKNPNSFWLPTELSD